MPWNFMQVEIVQDGRRLLPIIGPGYLTRAEAHAAIQTLLDRLGYPVADAWRAGAKDLITANMDRSHV